MLHTGSFAVFAQALLRPKDFGNSLYDIHRLIDLYESVQALSQIRFGGKTSCNANRETYFLTTAGRRLCNVVDLRVRAPERAACDRYLELSWKIVKVGIARQAACRCQRNWSRIQRFIVCNSGKRATCDVAHHIAASSFRSKPYRIEKIDSLGNRFDRQPVQLNTLPDGDVCHVAAERAAQVSDGPKLLRGKTPVCNFDAQHEVVAGFAFTALSA